MSEPSDSTPFLADTEDYNEESHDIKTPPANAHFKRPLKIITFFDALLSILIFALLIVTVVFINTGPFSGYTGNSTDAVRDLAIAIFLNFVFATPTIFLDIPIWINLAVQLTMSIVVLVFSIILFGNGWPDSSFCHRWSGPPDYRNLPELYDCKQSRKIIQIFVAVAGGFGIFIGLLLLTTLCLRLVAVARTKFWQGKKFKPFNLNSNGFTVQFTLSVLPNDGKSKSTDSNTQEGGLI